MKLNYLLICLGVTALAACTKEVDMPRETESAGFVFASEMGDATKVALAADCSLYWISGDAMSVYAYKSGSLFQKDLAKLSAGEGTGTGFFVPGTHTSNTSWYDADDMTPDYSFYAYYPSSGVLNPKEDKSVAIYSVSATQVETKGIGSYLICWASNNTTKAILAGGTAPSFAFSPKNALLKLAIRNNSSVTALITSIQISSASEKIAGTAKLNLETGVLASESNASNSITYTPSSPIEIPAGGMMAAPVLISLLPSNPGTLSVTLSGTGFSYTVEDISLSTVESGCLYAREVSITEIRRNELSITNNYTSNLANSSAMDADRALYYGMANSIVMRKDDTRAILSISLYKSVDGYNRSNTLNGSNPEYITAVKKAKIIWAEPDLYADPHFFILKGDTSRLIIEKSAGVTGNALVGIYDADDNLLWSYHIWCPEDASVKKVTSEGSSKSFTTFNLALGQITSATGDTYMCYQWGRKDPLGRAGYSVLSETDKVAYSETGETVNNLAFARMHPTTFITDGNVSPYDWYVVNGKTAREDQNDHLWRSDAATIFDPCPQGYHVAPKALWDGVSDKTEGALFNAAGLWYVLGGGRSHESGAFAYVSSYGGYWASDVPGSNELAYKLHFNSSTLLDRAQYDGRACAFGVRCVKD